MIERVTDVAPPLTNEFSWQLVFWGLEFSAGRAQAEYWTDGASRLAGQGYDGAQFHHGLVEIARALAAKQCFGGLPERLGCQAGPEHTSQHPLNVPVHDSRGRIKHDAGNGRCRVAAAARENAQFCYTVG